MVNFPFCPSGDCHISVRELTVGLASYPNPCSEWDDFMTGHDLGHQLEEIMLLSAPVSNIPVKCLPSITNCNVGLDLRSTTK